MLFKYKIQFCFLFAFSNRKLKSEWFISFSRYHSFFFTSGDVNRVRLGELDFASENDDAEPEDFNVRKTIEHPAYNYGQPYNDIGLIILSTTVKFNRYKHPACLPTTSSTASQNHLIAIGWGHTRFAGESSSHLQKVSLKYYPWEHCQWLAEGVEGRERFPNGLQYSQICAGSTEEKDTCQGDSGGPLLAQHPKYPCMFNVVGITAFGIGGCAIPNVPAIYTNVNYYIDWISNYIHWNNKISKIKTALINTFITPLSLI